MATHPKTKKAAGAKMATRNKRTTAALTKPKRSTAKAAIAASAGKKRRKNAAGTRATA